MLWVTCCYLLLSVFSDLSGLPRCSCSAARRAARAAAGAAAAATRRASSDVVRRRRPAQAAAIRVYLAGGVIEAQFSFSVVIVALTLYEDWPPFLLAVGDALLHHGVVGMIAATRSSAAGPVLAHPWKRGDVHAFSVAAAGVAGLAAWRLNESVRRMREAQA